MAEADDGEHTHAASVDAGAYHVLWQSRTSGFEAIDPAQPAPTFLMPEGGVTLEIVPVDEASVVVPMPEPTPTPTPRRTPRPTTRPTPTATAGTAQVAPPPDRLGLRRAHDRHHGPAQQGLEHQAPSTGATGASTTASTITLDQFGKGGDGTQAIVHVLPVDEVASTLKVKAPERR